MGQEFPKEAAGVRAGTGLCPRVGRPNLCTETFSFDGTGVPKNRRQESAWALGSVPRLENPTY